MLVQGQDGMTAERSDDSVQPGGLATGCVVSFDEEVDR